MKGGRLMGDDHLRQYRVTGLVVGAVVLAMSLILVRPEAASGRAATLGRTEGLTKIIADPESDRVLGVGIVGAGAGELIAEGVLAVEMAATAGDLALSIHPHPTLSETLSEAGESIHGSTVHLYRPRK